ncbi:MAG: UpxY family transcription antiterminator [Bacteroidia bacterium]|nr:UpxY family transcription antiterminator [Bacteroidia bacterium]
MKTWYAIYTNHRHEKKVSELFQNIGITCFLPLHKVKKKWSDRVKIVEEPLFRSYVFVQIEDCEKTKVRETIGVINFVYWQKKPAIIRDDEIDTIKKFIGEYTNISVKNVSLKKNDKVRIDSGPLMWENGYVLKTGKKKAKILIESLGIELIAEIPIDKLVNLSSNKS